MYGAVRVVSASEWPNAQSVFQFQGVQHWCFQPYRNQQHVQDNSPPPRPHTMQGSACGHQHRSGSTIAAAPVQCLSLHDAVDDHMLLSDLAAVDPAVD